MVNKGQFNQIITKITQEILILRHRKLAVQIIITEIDIKEYGRIQQIR